MIVPSRMADDSLVFGTTMATCALTRDSEMTGRIRVVRAPEVNRTGVLRHGPRPPGQVDVDVPEVMNSGAEDSDPIVTHAAAAACCPLASNAQLSHYDR